MEIAECMVCGLEHRSIRLPDRLGGRPYGRGRSICTVCAEEIARLYEHREAWNPPRPPEPAATMDEDTSY